MNRLTAVSECKTDEKTQLTDGKPAEETIAEGRISYGYDGKDNLVSITYPKAEMGVKGLEFEYDRFNYLLNVKGIAEDDSRRLIREYTYDNFGRVSEMKDYTDFLSDKSKAINRSYSYDKYGRLTAIEYRDNLSGSSDEIKQAHYYGYDKNSNIIKEGSYNKYGKENGAVYKQIKEYVYDSCGRLMQTDIREMSSEGAGAGSTEDEGEEEGEDEEPPGSSEPGSEEELQPVEDNILKDETIRYEYDAAGNRIKERTEENGEELKEEREYTYSQFNQLISSTERNAAGEAVSEKTYTYDDNGNQIKAEDSKTGEETSYSYDADNRLKRAEGKRGDVIDYLQENSYNGFGQRVEKKEGNEETNYFYDGTAVLYTTDENSNMTSFNYIGAEDNILLTARPAENRQADFYTYTKDIRESTVNIIGADGKSAVTYEYDDYGETTALGSQSFYNEICYGAGVYDKTTGLYYLNARYYSPETGNFLTQDTYRGERSRTATLNLYGYCVGNPINYTDPSGHWLWGVAGAAMGAYDGYKHAKKKKYTGWKRAACVVGGAVLGAVNPCKIARAAKSGYKAYKAGKFGKKLRSAYKKVKGGKKQLKKPKSSKTKKYKVKKGRKVSKAKKPGKVTKRHSKKPKPKCFAAGTKISTKDGFKNIEHIKAGDYVWSENPETHEKALKKVKKIFVREKDSIVRLSINGEVIRTTAEHPLPFCPKSRRRIARRNGQRSRRSLRRRER